MNEFWMVWCEDGTAPKVKHSSVTEAKREAERLARKDPGRRFFVLHCGEYVSLNPAPVQWVELNEIPF